MMTKPIAQPIKKPITITIAKTLEKDYKTHLNENKKEEMNDLNI
jgi:hypothetical protein